MSLLTGRDIIEKGIMTATELHHAFKTGEMTALDGDNNYQTIDWEKPKSVFQEICKLADQPGKYQLKQGVTYYSKGVSLDDRSKEPMNPPPKIGERHRLFRDEQKQDRIPEKTLLSFLRNEWKQTRIPADQYDEIIEGWGATQEKRILLDAVFEIEAENNQESYIEHLEKIDIENKGIGKTVHMHREQLPAAFNFCAGLLIEHVDPEKLDKRQFTRKNIVDMAAKAGIGQKLARDIHKNLPPVLKPK